MWRMRVGPLESLHLHALRSLPTKERLLLLKRMPEERMEDTQDTLQEAIRSGKES
jgi:hypothetical protein